MEVLLQTSSCSPIFLSSYERVSALFSKITAWIRLEEPESHFDKLAYELLLLIFEACKDPTDGYTFVKAVSPRLDEYWQKHGLTLLRSWYNNTLYDAEVVKMRRFAHMPFGQPQGSSKYISCFTLKSSVLWPRFLHRELQNLGREELEIRVKGGIYFESFNTAGYGDSQDGWRKQVRQTRELLHQHMEKSHKGPLTAEVLHQCLLECGHLSEYWSTRVPGFISLEIDDGVIPTIPLMYPKVEQHLLLTLEEFRPLLKYHLLEWCCDRSALQKSLWLRDYPSRYKSEDGIKRSTKFIQRDAWMLENLELLDIEVSKETRNFVAGLLADSD